MIQSLLQRFFYFLSYLSRPPWDTGISPPELIRFIDQNPPGRALDLGCGTGTNVITLAQNGWQVTGVDFVGRAIQKARHKVKQAGIEVRLLVEDVTQLERVSDPFDLILDIGCFHSLAVCEKEAYTENIRRLLADGGTYLLYAWLADEYSSISGLEAQDLERFGQFFHLAVRENGTERGLRPSAWFTFRKETFPPESYHQRELI